MLDPVSAIGLLATVLQVVDFSSKVINEGRQLYKTGTTTEQQHLRETTNTFRDLTKSIQDGLAASATDSRTLNQEDQALRVTCQKADALATELLSLDKRRPPGSNNTIGSLNTAFKNTLNRSERDKLKDKLKDVEKSLNLQILADHRRKLEAQRIAFSAQFGSISRDLRGATHLIENFEARTKNTVEAQTNIILTAMESNKYIPAVAPAASAQDVYGEAAQEVQQEARNRLMTALNFQGIIERQDSIEEAHKQTFRWVLKKDSAKDIEWSNFMVWLESGTGVYWIAGKPASGKSTLMKFLVQQPATGAAARVWAQSNTLVIASFFFYNLGLPLQKSQEGLLRTLLRTILRHAPTLIPVVFSEHYQLMLEAVHQRQVYVPSWTAALLRRALLETVASLPSDFNLCLFIDGLDEYEGDATTLLEVLANIKSSQVKLVVSSRPEPIYRHTFKDCPQLWLEKLTRADITAYVEDRMSRHITDLKASTVRLHDVTQLVQEIVQKASGVFLWVVLVVNSLIHGLVSYDSISLLRKRLESIPEKLQHLYRHMMDRMEPSYRLQACKYLQLVLRSTEVQRGYPMALSQLWCADPGVGADPHVDIFELTIKDFCQPEFEAKLNAQCCGLLEIQVPSTGVKFIHKSVADFLRYPEIWEDVNGSTLSIGWDPNVPLARSCIPMFKDDVEQEGSAVLESRCSTHQINYFLEYLHCVEKINQRTQTRLLSCFRGVVSARLNKEKPWLPRTESCLLPRTDLRRLKKEVADMAIAACAGLSLHLEELVVAHNIYYSKHDLDIVLSLALLKAQMVLAYHYNYLQDTESIIKCLVKHSASPESASVELRRAWRQLISSLLCFSGYVSAGGHELMLMCLRLAQYFVEHGAVDGSSGDGGTLKDLDVDMDDFTDVPIIPDTRWTLVQVFQNIKYEGYYREDPDELESGLREFHELRQSVVDLIIQSYATRRRKRDQNRARIYDKMSSFGIKLWGRRKHDRLVLNSHSSGIGGRTACVEG